MANLALTRAREEYQPGLAGLTAHVNDLVARLRATGVQRLTIDATTGEVQLLTQQSWVA
jgi:hypothetical protein